MSHQPSEQTIYEEAKQIVKKKRDFYTHLAVYVMVNAILVIVWATSGAGSPWFIYPLGFWGIGVLVHFFDTFIFHRGSAWEKREIEKEVERLRREQG